MKKAKTQKVFTKAEAEDTFKKHNQVDTVLKTNGNVKAEPPAEGDECQCAACQTHVGKVESADDLAKAPATK